MDQIFNELSANGSYANKYEASAGMERMLRLSNDLTHCGFSRNLRVVERFPELLIAPDYSIHQWSTDRSIGVDRDLQRQLMSIVTRAPYLEELIADEEHDSLFEFKFDGQLVYGLGLAYLWESFALSMDGDVQFSQSNIDVEFYQVCDNIQSSRIISVNLVSNSDQLEAVCSSLKKTQIANVDNGKSLVEQLPILFPNLACGGEAIKQLSALNGCEQFFQDIIQHFFILNNTIQNWSAGPFIPQGIKWSRDSEATLNQFAHSRQFCCNDGKTRQFSLHTKIMSANRRIYFDPEIEKKVVHIGYVGKHLPTVLYRT